MRDIQIAMTDKQILATYGIMKELHSTVRKMQKLEYLDYVKTLQVEVGFKLTTLTEKGSVICAAGFRVCQNLGWGKYLYVDDLVTDPRCRSKRAGKEMLDWLIARARSQQCVEMRLDCRVDRHEAHRFYLRERMDIIAFHFCLKL